MEILLHTVIETEPDPSQNLPVEDDLLPITVEFLDYFDAALEVVVGCARKTEMARWRRLFNVVGNPKTLFEVSSDFDIFSDRLMSFVDLPILEFIIHGWLIPLSAS